LGAGAAAAQVSSKPVTIPAGHYIVEARDTGASGGVAMAGWPFELKGNGDFVFTSPDSLTWTGKMVQNKGIVTYTDQGCGDPGLYYVHQKSGGYILDRKSEACPGRDSAMVMLLFRPVVKH
jgi:hypothetical protein